MVKDEDQVCARVHAEPAVQRGVAGRAEHQRGGQITDTERKTISARHSAPRAEQRVP